MIELSVIVFLDEIVSCIPLLFEAAPLIWILLLLITVSVTLVASMPLLALFRIILLDTIE